MAELKTKPTQASVTQFISKVTPEARRLDALALLKIMKRATGESPKLWGANIVGYGTCTMKYASGREVEWMLVGFSPRKPSLVIYGAGVARYPKLMAKLGKHKTGKGCLYVTNLADVDNAVLEDLIRTSIADLRKKHGAA